MSKERKTWNIFIMRMFHGCGLGVHCYHSGTSMYKRFDCRIFLILWELDFWFEYKRREFV